MKILSNRQWAALQRRLERPRPKPAETYEVSGYREAKAFIHELWDMHSKPYMTSEPGFGLIGQEWYCHTCRTSWPCATAQILSRWGQVGEAKTAEYEPLRLTVKRGSE